MPPREKETEISIAKVPPNSKEVEEGVIGAILIIPNGYFQVIDFLVAEAFYVDAHKKVFKACSKLASKFLPIDVQTVSEELFKAKELEEIGGMLAVMGFINKATTNLEYHAKIIQQKFVLREIIRISYDTSYAAFENGAEANDILDNTTTELYNLTKGIFKKDFTTPEKNSIQAKEELYKKINREPGTLTGMTSGFLKLDACTGGWQDTDLIILAARPSVGKTALALNLAFNLAKTGKGVAFFSLEMSTGQLIKRLISSISEVDHNKINKATLTKDELERIDKALNTIAETPIFIDDTAGINTLEMRAKIRRLKEKHDIGLVIIDYLQLMAPVEHSKGKTTNDQIGEISRELKKIQKDFSIPVMPLSQLTRGIESRTEAARAPKLSDLRDSGAIEQDADIVMFLWMEEETKLRIAKHRNGSLETFILNRDMSIQKFTEKGSEPFRPKPDKSSKNFDEGLPEAESEDFNFKK